MIKKVISALLVLSIFASCTFAYPIAATASTDFQYSGNFDMDNFLEEFSTAPYDNRSTKTPEKEKNAALFLAEKFFDIGLSTFNLNPAESKEKYLQTFNYGSALNKSQNVIAVKPASENAKDAKSVIIGAHYDNVYDYEITNPYNKIKNITQSNGTYDNASGVAIMMSLAYNLVDEQLPFNLIFVAFGAEEAGLYGSKHFHSGLSKSEKDDILMFFNLDSIAAGDYLYLFTKDWKVFHDIYLRDMASELNIPLKSMPRDKKYSLDVLGKYYYSHIGYYSDNYYFIHDEINTAFFFSFNLQSTSKAGAVESDNHDDIMHTLNDNYIKLNELYGKKYLLKMQYVSQLIYTVLLKPDFAEAMVLSKNKAPNYSLIMNEKALTVATLVSCIIFIVLAYFYYINLKKIANAKLKEYLDDPIQKEKIDKIFKEFQNQINNQNVFTYHPRTYKPKQGEDEFTVFGKEFEDKDEGYGKHIDNDSKQNASNKEPDKKNKQDGKKDDNDNWKLK